jgi:hypothetical protein
MTVLHTMSLMEAFGEQDWPLMLGCNTAVCRTAIPVIIVMLSCSIKRDGAGEGLLWIPCNKEEKHKTKV